MTYFELAPACGRDYKSKAEVVAAWADGKDFEGDYQLGFRPVNKPDLERDWKGKATVNLRYKGLRSVAVVKV